MLGEILPGSAPSIANYDLQRTAVNAIFVDGIDPAFVDSYNSYYVSLNPWIDYWSGLPSGEVTASEQHFPSASFRDSEFYRDWLGLQDNMAAAVGMRLDLNRRNTIHVAWHYDVARAPEYDAVASAILEGLRPALREAAEASLLLSDQVDGRARLSILLENIDGAALLVTGSRCIREANANAEAAMRAGTVMLTCTSKRLVVRESSAQRWLEEIVARLANGEVCDDTSMTFTLDDQVLRLTATPVPAHLDGSFALLVSPPPQVLVVLRRLAGGVLGLDHASLRLAYGLSASETRLCEIFINGLSIAEAASLLELSEGTIRQRVKVIFQKTQTHRQGELIARLRGFVTSCWEGGGSASLPFGSR